MMDVMHLDAPARRITTWLAILGYTLVASGLPLPLGSVGAPVPRDTASARRLAAKDRSQPFPCMDKPCGCDTADRCFTSCCCHTPAETLAWARAHGVEPALLVALERRVTGAAPASVQAAAKATPTNKPTPKKSSCCAAAPRVESSCCSTAPTTPGSEIPSWPEICSDRQSLAAAPRATADGSVCTESVSTEQEVPADGEPAPRSRTVTLRAMLACGGIVAEWFAAGAALPPPRVDISRATVIFDVCMPADEAGECLRASPAAPPPRAA
jgi:hypothetical protein